MLPEFHNLKFLIATPDDAENLSELYRKVYGRDYPAPELFTPEGMKEFLTFERSKTVTTIVLFSNEIIASGTYQISGRTVYSRGFMVSPVWQGKISAKKIIQQMCHIFGKFFSGKVDYFYGEVRTESGKIQSIIEEIGWVPVAILPRKDIFYGKRETEFLCAWYYHNPQPGSLKLTPKAAQVASEVLQRPITFIQEHYASHSNLIVPICVERKLEPYGDFHVFITLPTGGKLSASLCHKSANSEKVVINSNDFDEFYSLVVAFLKELFLLNIVYTEIFIDAREPTEQAILEGLGFNPTGFVTQWYAQNKSIPHDYVVYTLHRPSSLPDCPIQTTQRGEYLKKYVNPPIGTPIIAKSSPSEETLEVINAQQS
ncbi:MAG: hypothetical protein RBG13Loki_2772 [Promethearchaeota archaeon CR_4]|nr:MAG: hypothetical protein RBG13Loki_2772 [Candidatus Lokiarchaeota archaeon CR_4]